MKKIFKMMGIVAMFFLVNTTNAQNPFVGLGIGKTSKGYTSASFWGRDIFLLNKAGISLSPYLRFMNQYFQSSDIYLEEVKVEHDEQVLGCILNFQEEKHPGFQDLSFILAIGRFEQRDHSYLFVADKDGYGIKDSYLISNEKEGISFEAGMSWRFHFKKVENFCFNINYTANTYSLFTTTIGVSILMKQK